MAIGRSLPRNRFIYMMVTNDEYELPTAVADTAEMLSQITGVKVDRIYKSAVRNESGHKPCRGEIMFVRVDREEQK